MYSLGLTQYNIMNITPEIVRNLLDTLVTPEFKDSIVDYRITTQDNDNGITEGINVDVILNYESHEDMYYHGKDLEYETTEMEKTIRGVLRYLAPKFTIVEFYVDDEYIITSPY